MNKNFTAFCASMLAFCLMFVIIQGGFIRKHNISLAEESTVKTVYLTFDDGPSDKVTPKILDILAEEEVKATFFIIGKQAETRKYLIEREFNEGHTVAVHSYSHRYSDIYSSTEALLTDIDKCNKVIKEVTGSYSYLYRFPGGSFGLDSKLIKATVNHGMRYIDWNASVRDAEICNAKPEQLYKAAVTTSADTDNVVLLMHDSTTKTATAQALKSIIKHFKDKGYIFKAF